MKNILFVCLGNICRSPMAEGAMKDLLKRSGLENDYFIESAGTAAYHIGKLPDSRMRATARKHDIELTSKARQFNINDFQTFDYILAMDASNKRDILKLASSEEDKSKVLLMRSFDEATYLNEDVPDPYYGGDAGFENVFQIVSRCSTNLLAFLERKI